MPNSIYLSRFTLAGRPSAGPTGSGDPMTGLQDAQQLLQHLADSREWWVKCRSCNGTGRHNWEDEPDGGLSDPLPCDLCNSTGKVLRYPHLFEAVFEPRRGGNRDRIRPVMEFWWLVFGCCRITISTGGVQARLEDGTFGEAALSGRHPAPAFIEALKRILPAKVGIA